MEMETETRLRPKTATVTINPNAVILSKLSIERCQSHLAHLHALMHLCNPSDFGQDRFVTENVLDVMGSIERDLLHSANALSEFG